MSDENNEIIDDGRETGNIEHDTSDDGRYHGQSERDSIMNSILARSKGPSDDDLAELERMIEDGSLFSDDEEEKEEEKEAESASDDSVIVKKDEKEDDGKASDDRMTMDEFLRLKNEERKASEEAFVASEKAKKEADIERRLMELEAKERALLDYQQRLMNNTTTKEQSVGSDESDDPFKAFSKDLIEGEDEKAADKLKEGVGKLLKGSVSQVEEKITKLESDFDQRVMQVARRIDLERQWESALVDFSEKRKDINDDPFLADLFNRNLRVAAENGASPRQSVALAEREIDNWIEKRFGAVRKVEQKQEAVVEKKETAKKYALKSGGSVKAEAKVDREYEQESPSSVIASMLRERSRVK